jgi:hypothetical protein
MRQRRGRPAAGGGGRDVSVRLAAPWGVGLARPLLSPPSLSPLLSSLVLLFLLFNYFRVRIFLVWFLF